MERPHPAAGSSYARLLPAPASLSATGYSRWRRLATGQRRHCGRVPHVAQLFAGRGPGPNTGWGPPYLCFVNDFSLSLLSSSVVVNPTGVWTGFAPFVLLLRPNRSSYAVARRLVLVSLLIFSSTSPSIFMRRSSGEVCSIIFFFLGRFEGTESERDFDPLGDLFFYNHFHQSSSNQRNQQGFIFLFYSLRSAKVVSFSSTLSVPQKLFV